MAVDRTPSDLDGIRIDCPHCGTYDVASGVLDRLLRLDLPQRADALGQAKRQATKDQTPIVDSRSLQGIA
jgi:Zn-finger nucleic acid-binding protein